MVSDPILRQLFFECPLLSDTDDPRNSFLASLPIWERGKLSIDSDDLPLRYFTVFRSEYFGEVEIQVSSGTVNVIMENPDVAEVGFLNLDEVENLGLTPFDGDPSALFAELQRGRETKRATRQCGNGRKLFSGRPRPFRNPIDPTFRIENIFFQKFPGVGPPEFF